jgi:predicted nucleic acid-binding Zn ribbon protein
MPTVNGRLCTECGEPLPPGSARTRKTCSDNCRSARSRRIKRAHNTKQALPPEIAAVSDVTHGDTREIANQVIKEQLQPIVREALTEDVLRSIDKIVALTPKAIAELEKDLESEDGFVRRKAVEQVLKYTIGHQALLTKDDTANERQLVVNFSLPRPDAEPEQPQLAEAEELRICDTCHADKPVAEFVDNSTRCQSCHDDIRERAYAALKGSAD